MRWRYRMPLPYNLAVLIPVVGLTLTWLPAQAQSQVAAQVATANTHIDIDNFDFAPMTLKVVIGTKITWTNHDDAPHTVVSADNPPLFKSPPLDTDDAYAFTFLKPGIYKYFCSVHPKMVGTIVVQEK